MLQLVQFQKRVDWVKKNLLIKSFYLTLMIIVMHHYMAHQLRKKQILLTMAIEFPCLLHQELDLLLEHRQVKKQLLEIMV